ncbi:MAG: hypothetical protein LC104_03870 [Bacteroidales bacterium]|nr:hypothetical protein [Bacteroidales bacterium]
MMRVSSLIGGILSLVICVGCSQSGGDAHPDSLSGKITIQGQPAAEATMIVTGPNGATAGGSANAAGEYIIPEPPKGLLKFQFFPGAKKDSIPPKYLKPDNGLSFEYIGGKQTYDIELKR